MNKRFYILIIMCLSLFPIISSAKDGSQDLDSRYEYEYNYSYQYDAIDSIYEKMAYFYNNSQYDDAIELGEKLLSLYPNQTSYNTYWMLAECYKRKYNYEQAISLFSKAKEFYPENAYLYDYNLALLSKEIGDCYYELGKSEVALRFYNEIRDPSVLADLSIDFFKIYDFDKSIHYISKAITILKDNNKYDTDRSFSLQNLAVMYGNLSVFYYYKGENKLAYTKIRESLDILYPHILSDFRIRTATERAELWNKFSWTFQTVFPSIAYAINNPSSTRQLYDMSALFAKGILLSTDTEFDRLLLESNDTLAIGAHEELQDLRDQISIHQQAGPILRNDTLLEELNEQKQEIEFLLLNYVRSNIDTFGDITQNLQFTWRDVREKLRPDDIAIEFLSFPKLGSDSTFYIALTVRKDYDTPHMVFLGEENELNAAAKKAYTSNELSHLIWGKLSNELKGDEKLDTVKNIYFSPGGMLHQIAIESMPHWEKEGSLMNQCYNIYRLSSTRELVIDRENIQPRTAAVFGDINYNTEVKLLPTSHTANDPLLLAENRDFDADSAGYRGKIWNPLKYAKNEIDSIFDILKNTEIMVDSMTVDAATETSFKNLTGKKKSIIHIATHGFCWSDSTASKYNMKKQLSFMTGENFEDKVMTRSGLLFSGANNCFADSVKIPYGKDDGVLTAREASLLDLRGLDLLVLSACQTGRGEIIGGEGVFGLQRGFKKAGAQTIIMSLWSVNDKATSEMMTKFYHHYFDEGMTKREAFLEAQKDIKNIYGNYKDKNHTKPTDKPHWAAFILLDALDKR